MATQEVKLPDIGEGVTEGELVKWLVKPGDQVVADQPVAEFLTDKATVEIPTPFNGVVKELLRKEGDVVPIESPLLSLDTESESAVTKKVEQKKQPTSSPIHQRDNQSAESAISGAATSSASKNVQPPVAEFKTLATPATRRLARELGVDINYMGGSGPLGRVTRDDVLRAKEISGGAGATVAGRPQMSPMTSSELTREGLMAKSHVIQNREIQLTSLSGSKNPEERVSLRGIRKKIAENLQMAKRIVPHFTLMEEVDVSSLVQVREQMKVVGEKVGLKITYLPLVMKALIATLREYPMFNASIDDQASEIVYKNYFNLGFAADTPNGLLVPVIKNADQKNILTISQEIMALAHQAREGKLPLESMKGATITITNIGSVGGVYATPIINHPEVAILGMYKIVDRPVWQEGQWVPRQFMNFTITCDHRLIDGAVAANFMKDFARRIESPAQMMLEMI